MGVIAPQKVFMDMDPGIDDALALVVALRRLDVVGITTVAGNVPVGKTFENAQRVLSVAGREDIPVVAGADAPLFYPLVTAQSIHGPSGLEGYEFAATTYAPGSRKAWMWVADELRQSELPRHIIATGPLTNLALLLWSDPDAAERIASICWMGGAMPGAIMDKTNEFNVYVDPHAADVVFRHGVRVRMIGINVTHRALVPLSDLPRLKRYGTVGAMLFGLLSSYAERARGEGGNPDAMPVDDVVTVAALDAPELFQWDEMPLTVVREGPLRGSVVISPYAIQRPAVKVATHIDVPGFLDWLWDSLDR